MGGCSDAKVTTMILSVDLDCCPCYRKVKKLLCKFPQIRDQVFDEKHNTVTITVVCCSPEKIKDKLCEKGGKSIKGIAIKAESDKKPKSEDKSKGGDEQIKEKKDKPKGGDDQTKEKKDKSKGGDEQIKEKKDKPKGGDDEKPKSKSGDDKVKDKDKDTEKGSSGEKPNKEKSKESSDPAKQKEAAPALAPAAAAAQAWMAEPQAQWIPAYPPGPPPQVYPVSVYYGGPSYCYDGVPVGPPCYQNQQGYGYSYGRPPCPPGYYPNRSDYFSEENPAACTIM